MEHGTAPSPSCSSSLRIDLSAGELQDIFLHPRFQTFYERWFIDDTLQTRWKEEEEGERASHPSSLYPNFEKDDGLTLLSSSFSGSTPSFDQGFTSSSSSSSSSSSTNSFLLPAQSSSSASFLSLLCGDYVIPLPSSSATTSCSCTSSTSPVPPPLPAPPPVTASFSSSSDLFFDTSASSFTSSFCSSSSSFTSSFCSSFSSTLNSPKPGLSPSPSFSSSSSPSPSPTSPSPFDDSWVFPPLSFATTTTATASSSFSTSPSLSPPPSPSCVPPTSTTLTTTSSAFPALAPAPAPAPSASAPITSSKEKRKVSTTNGTGIGVGGGKKRVLWRKRLSQLERELPSEGNVNRVPIPLQFASIACPSKSLKSSTSSLSSSTLTYSQEGGPERGNNGEGLTRQRLIWTPELQTLFQKAIDFLGPEEATPKAILIFMAIPGLTRENVSSHLQKQRKKKRREEAIAAANASQNLRVTKQKVK